MPRKDSAAERADTKQFVRELYERSGARSQSELAAQMGVLASQVSEWLNPERQELPDAVNLLKLIRVAQELPTRPEQDEVVASLSQEMQEIQQLLRAILAQLEGEPEPAGGRS